MHSPPPPTHTIYNKFGTKNVYSPLSHVGMFEIGLPTPYFSEYVKTYVVYVHFQELTPSLESLPAPVHQSILFYSFVLIQQYHCKKGPLLWGHLPVQRPYFCLLIGISALKQMYLHINSALDH